MIQRAKELVGTKRELLNKRIVVPNNGVLGSHEPNRKRLQANMNQDRKPRCWIGRVVGACVLGGLIAPVARGQTPGDLRVPDFLIAPPKIDDAPATPRAPATGDPARAFSGMPGQAFQGPIGGGGGQHRAAGLTYGLYAAVDTSYTDNALQTAAGPGVVSRDDLTVTSTAGVRLSYGINEHSSLDLSIGVSYRYSMNYGAFTRFNIVPDSYISYKLLVGPVLLDFYNRSSSAANSRGEIAGNGNAAAVSLNRISNSTGLTASWQPTQDMSVSVGYSFAIERGLGDKFSILDSNIHSLYAGVYERLSPYWTVGLSASWSATSYVERFQNDSTSYGAGPMISFTPNAYISITASVRYQVIDSSSTGTVADQRNFGGVTWNVAASQVLTRNISHSISVSSGVQSGLGSNFTETFAVGYQISWQFMKAIGLSGGVSYADMKQSGKLNGVQIYFNPDGTISLVPASITTNDSAASYDAHIGTGYQFTPNIRASLSYSYRLRDSTSTSRSYHSNTVSLGVGFSF